MLFKSVLSALSLAVTGAFAAAGQLQQLTSNIGPNPTNVGIFYYKPAKLASPPPLIVAMHYCSGTAQAYFTGTTYATLADQHGFIVIYPNAPTAGGCWDVATNATLTHNAGGDSLGIVSSVRWAIANWGVDATRVFATGTSSGAMMTNVLMGAYPDVFAAGSLFSGVPFACFEGPTAWNSQCSTGELILTPQQWVRSSCDLYDYLLMVLSQRRVTVLGLDTLDTPELAPKFNFGTALCKLFALSQPLTVLICVRVQ